MIGVVEINKLNLIQGTLKSPENYLLFVGQASGKNQGKVIAINSQTNVNLLLGEADSPLKTAILAAQANGKQNWNAAVLPIADESSRFESALLACGQSIFEGVVFTKYITESSEVEAMQAFSQKVMATYMQPIFSLGQLRPLLRDKAGNITETWEEYQVYATSITKGIAADQVSLTAPLFGAELGSYAGRLCDKSVTVADTPMRVKTGSLVGSWSVRPTDKNSRPLDMSIIKSIHDSSRISLPQWYTGYDGIYFTDGTVLDTEGGDFQKIENLRVIHKAMRRVYPLAVARIGDRTLNETAASIAQAKIYFANPLREMAKSRTIKGITFPGEIHPPSDDAIAIIWRSKYAVELWITVQPYKCPKKITCNLLLDLTEYN